jgi:hypothetical protein
VRVSRPEPRGASAGRPRVRRGSVASAIPTSTTAAPSSCSAPAGSPSSVQPSAAPTTGSRLTNEPASSGRTCACPRANSQNGSGVPAPARAMNAASAGICAGAAGAPSVSAAIGAASAAAAANCTAVTAAGSRPARIRGWTEISSAESAAEASTRASPAMLAPPPEARETSATPQSASSWPAHACRPGAGAPPASASSETSSGTSPTSSAACTALVRSIPAFCKSTTTP